MNLGYSVDKRLRLLMVEHDLTYGSLGKAIGITSQAVWEASKKGYKKSRLWPFLWENYGFDRRESLNRRKPS